MQVQTNPSRVNRRFVLVEKLTAKVYEGKQLIATFEAHLDAQVTPQDIEQIRVDTYSPLELA